MSIENNGNGNQFAIEGEEKMENHKDSGERVFSASPMLLKWGFSLGERRRPMAISDILSKSSYKKKGFWRFKKRRREKMRREEMFLRGFKRRERETS